MPVAKINFSTRHKHGESKSSVDGSDDGTRGSKPQGSSVDGGASTSSSAKPVDPKRPSSAKKASSKRSDKASNASNSSPRKRPKKEDGGSDSYVVSSEGDELSLTGQESRSSKQQQWLRLLDERPATKDRAKMKAWITRLVEASDPDGDSGDLGLSSIAEEVLTETQKAGDKEENQSRKRKDQRAM